MGKCQNCGTVVSSVKICESCGHSACSFCNAPSRCLNCHSGNMRKMDVN